MPWVIVLFAHLLINLINIYHGLAYYTLGIVLRPEEKENEKDRQTNIMINLISALMEVSSICFLEYMESGPNPGRNFSSSTWASLGVLSTSNLKSIELRKCQLLNLKGYECHVVFGCLIILS